MHVSGTVQWVENLKWTGIQDWRTSVRKPIIISNSTEMFVKSFKNFGFYWVLKAGHMVIVLKHRTLLSPKTFVYIELIYTSYK